jgi:hypothetical protein
VKVKRERKKIRKQKHSVGGREGGRRQPASVSPMHLASA